MELYGECLIAILRAFRLLNAPLSQYAGCLATGQLCFGPRPRGTACLASAIAQFRRDMSQPSVQPKPLIAPLHDLARTGRVEGAARLRITKLAPAPESTGECDVRAATCILTASAETDREAVSRDISTHDLRAG